MTTADLILHPVRLRIVKAFLGDRALTTTQLTAELDDVPAASIYRHVARLTRAGVLQVVAERRVRGAVERTYTLRLIAAQLGAGEVAAMSRDDHERAFAAFVAGLLADFDRYLARDTPDLMRDRVSYGALAMWVTETEYAEFLRELAAVLQPRLANAPRRGRHRRMLHSVFLPAPDPVAGSDTTGSTARSRASSNTRKR